MVGGRKLALLVAIVGTALCSIGCGAGSTVTDTVTTGQAPRAVHAVQRRASLDNAAQPPNPAATVSCADAPVGHACVSDTIAPSNPNQFPQRNCDTNIVASSVASCPFAENTFYEYYESPQDAADGQTVRVHSPATGKDYSVSCSLREALIACTGEPLSTGIYVSFPSAAVEAYTTAQAETYASSRDVGHPGPSPSGTEASTEREEDSESEEGSEAEAGGEAEGAGSYSHAQDAEFCSAHNCIANFSNGNGAVVECADGQWSHSGGLSGACSDHGGENE